MNDHVFHNSFLKHIIAYSEKERSDKNLPPIKSTYFTLTTAPLSTSVVKTLEKLLHIVNIMQVHSWSINSVRNTGLEGDWDAIGKHVKYAILKNDPGI